MPDREKPPPSDDNTPPAVTIDGSEGRDEREGPWTLDELGDFVSDGFRSLLGTAADISRKVDALERGHEDLVARVGDIEGHVFSQPPPPPAGVAGAGGGPTVRVPAYRSRTKSFPALAAKVEQQTGEVDTLRGRLMAAEAAANRAEAKAEAAATAAAQAHAAAQTNVNISKQQSRHMGLSMPGARLAERAGRFIFSAEGMKSFVALLAAIAALVAAFKASGAHDEATRAADRAPVIVTPAVVVTDAGTR
jgi:hypothetical protein